MKCPVCNTEFELSKFCHTQKYCSEKCRKKVSNLKRSTQKLTEKEEDEKWLAMSFGPHAFDPIVAAWLRSADFLGSTRHG